jgi:hypothetical protein
MTEETTTKKMKPRPSPANGMRPQAFCEHFGISLAKFYSMKKAGQVRVISLGSRTCFIPLDEVARLERGDPPAAAPFAPEVAHAAADATATNP